MRVAWLGLVGSNRGRVRVGHYRRPCENGQMTSPGGLRGCEPIELKKTYKL